MDNFGIGAAILGSAQIYQRSARHSGRTTLLINSVKDGDRIYFHDGREAERVKRLCLERGLKVECLVVDVKRPESVFNYPASKGRAIFDHSWVENFYLQSIVKSMEAIDALEKQTSGFGSAHYETRRQAEEIHKWTVD